MKQRWKESAYLYLVQARAFFALSAGAPGLVEHEKISNPFCQNQRDLRGILGHQAWDRAILDVAPLARGARQSRAVGASRVCGYAQIVEPGCRHVVHNATNDLLPS